MGDCGVGGARERRMTEEGCRRHLGGCVGEVVSPPIRKNRRERRFEFCDE